MAKNEEEKSYSTILFKPFLYNGNEMRVPELLKFWVPKSGFRVLPTHISAPPLNNRQRTL